MSLNNVVLFTSLVKVANAISLIAIIQLLEDGGDGDMICFMD